MGFHWLNIIVLLIIVFWLVALMHCIVNKGLRVGEKVAWICALLFAKWCGAPGYFVYWYGCAKRKQNQMALRVQSSDIPSEPICAPYEQGYRQQRVCQSKERTAQVPDSRTMGNGDAADTESCQIIQESEDLLGSRQKDVRRPGFLGAGASGGGASIACCPRCRCQRERINHCVEVR